MGSKGEGAGVYSAPEEAQKLFQAEILNNALVPELPAEIQVAGNMVQFSGNAKPSIPINWRFAESAAALKAFEASMLNVLRQKKYGADLAPVKIDTDHASLFFMSPFLARSIENGVLSEPISPFTPGALEKYGIPSGDLHRASASLQRGLATNIYKTKDGRFYHIHGSMNPEPTLTALGLSLEGESGDTYDSVVGRIQAAVSKLDSHALDTLMNQKYRQAGTIAWTTEEFLASEHGKANKHVGLYNLQKSSTHSQPASWWPENSSMPSSAKRPLAGLKVVDLTRVIAAPTITRGLAEMGASVMRVTSPEVTDLTGVHLDLNWGKWTSHLHLKNEDDRQKLMDLIREADVVVEGYRPNVMKKYGLSREQIFDLVKDRPRGIIHVSENCYGWNGPWQERSGWQQISDACCGVSLGYGKAMGVNEAVTPVFPNSDYCTGIIGSVAVLHALIRRGEEGGSYGIDAALNYYSQWLIQSVGEYPPDVWNEVWRKNNSPVFHNYHSMQYTLPVMIKLLYTHDQQTLLKPEFFESRKSKAIGHEFTQVRPIAQFGDEVKLEFNVGTRGNGHDQPYWPTDLSVEVVT